MSILKRMGYILILLAPLDAFKLFSSYFSAYRVCALLMVMLTVLHIIKSGGKIVVHKSFSPWIIAFIGTCLVAYLISTNKSLGRSFFFNDILGIIVIMCFVYTYRKRDIEDLLIYYVRSQYVTIAFSFYAIVLHFVFRRSMSPSLSFLGLSLEMSDNQLALLARSKSFLPQLFLPYATTLHLEFSVGIAAFICLFLAERRKKGKTICIILFSIFSLLVLMSAQKGPIISFLLTLLVYMWGYQKRKGFAKSMFYTIVILILGLGAIVTFGQDVFLYTIERFVEFGIRTINQEDRHILLVYESIKIWLKSIKTFLLGVGYSSASMRQGIYTWIPETFLCTYATLIAERGLLGILSIFFYLRFYSSARHNTVIYIMFIYVVLNFLFYEMRYIQTTWIILSIFSVNLIAQNTNDLEVNEYG